MERDKGLGIRLSKAHVFLSFQTCHKVSIERVKSKEPFTLLLELNNKAFHHIEKLRKSPNVDNTYKD